MTQHLKGFFDLPQWCA